MAFPVDKIIETMSVFEPSITGVLYTLGLILIGFYTLQYLLLTLSNVPSELKIESFVNSTKGLFYLSTFFFAFIGFQYLLMAFTKPFQSK